MGSKSCEAWFEVLFGYGVSHLGCQVWACDKSNGVGMG